MNHTNVSAFFNSHRFVVLLSILGFLIIAVVIFEAGVAVGFHKASFAHDWEENYERNFGPAGAFGLPAHGVPNPHGATGRIVSVTLPTFVIAGDDEGEKTVRIEDDTLIRNGADTVASTTLIVGEDAVVLGTPDAQGEVEAKLIRLMEAPTSTPPAP